MYFRDILVPTSKHFFSSAALLSFRGSVDGSPRPSPALLRCCGSTFEVFCWMTKQILSRVRSMVFIATLSAMAATILVSHKALLRRHVDAVEAQQPPLPSIARVPA
ncbi:unnamed protein product, partial [Pylaiella littoralis]